MVSHVNTAAVLLICLFDYDNVCKPFSNLICAMICVQSSKDNISCLNCSQASLRATCEIMVKDGIKLTVHPILKSKSLYYRRNIISYQH